MAMLRKPGMDHNYYDWSPIATRRSLSWPHGARIAFCVIVNLERYDWADAAPPYIPLTMPGGIGPRPFPDIGTFAHREYGNRVGIFRVMEALDKYDIKATAAIDVAVAANYPFIVKECVKRGWEFMAHGLAVNKLVTANMTETQERAYIRASIAAVAKAAGQRPAGWLGPEYGESARTPRLLAAEGVRYICDWPNDEQPYPMKGGESSLFALPVELDLDDVFAIWTRNLTVMEYVQCVCDAFDTLYEEGRRSGRLLALSLHPWLIGQPYRVKYLDQILAHICKYKLVWKATAGEIVKWAAGRM